MIIQNIASFVSTMGLFTIGNQWKKQSASNFIRYTNTGWSAWTVRLIHDAVIKQRCLECWVKYKENGIVLTFTLILSYSLISWAGAPQGTRTCGTTILVVPSVEAKSRQSRDGIVPLSAWSPISSECLVLCVAVITFLNTQVLAESRNTQDIYCTGGWLYLLGTQRTALR